MPPLKVAGPNGTGAPLSVNRDRRGGGGGSAFSVGAAETTASTSKAAAPQQATGVWDVDALLALQEVGSPLERKRRSVRRAGRLLDELDALKLALLGGELTRAQLERMERAIREQRDATDDPKLESVLDEIETRARVELAKLEQIAAASGTS